MSEHIKNAPNGNEQPEMEQKIEQPETEQKIEQPEAVKPLTVEQVSKGVIKLAKPIRARGGDLTELNYDFGKITGWEYVEAMDSDREAHNAFRTTRKQLLALFAAAAGKATPDVDATDIKQRIGLVDAMHAVQVTKVFLNVSDQAGSVSFSGT